ncbi:hypothetical protein R1flu_004578 [Riccia fluitans]|uniref:Uncharacterized protein n=1 Tax=Riccia fluitans TaxID=41844 RepID=A0ABD1YTM2_9MARC
MCVVRSSSLSFLYLAPILREKIVPFTIKSEENVPRGQILTAHLNAVVNGSPISRSVTVSGQGTITAEELQKRLTSMEKVGKAPAGSGKQAHQHMTLYLQELTLALFAAAKWESEHLPNEKDTSLYFNSLYNADLSKYLEAYLQNPADVEETEMNDLTLHAAAFLIDETKLVLRGLAESSKTEHRRVSHAIHLMRTLCAVIDRRTPYQEQHANTPLPEWLPSHPFRRFTNASVSGSPLQESHVENISPSRKNSNFDGKDDEQSLKVSVSRGSDCKQGKYLRVKLLLEHFGNGSSIPGYQLLVSLLYATVSQKVTIEVGEVVLRFVSTSIEFLKDHKKSMFLAPCLDILRHVYSCYASQRLEVISVSTVTMVMHHLGVIFQSLLPAEIANQLIEDMQKRQRDQFLRFLHPAVSMAAPPTGDNTSHRRGHSRS